jgi:UDP-glucose 4-epimerase
MYKEKKENEKTNKDLSDKFATLPKIIDLDMHINEDGDTLVDVIKNDNAESPDDVLRWFGDLTLEDILSSTVSPIALCSSLRINDKMVELIKNYSNWFGLNYEICYFFNVYGEGQITEGDYATVIGIFERQYNYNKSLTVVSPGTQTRDFTNVEDIVDGIISSTEKNLKGEWHLRSGKNTSIIDIANMFKSKWEIVPERRGERLNSIEIITDTEEKLDWKPKHKIEDWINKIIKK